jgi:hypothetical protein
MERNFNEATTYGANEASEHKSLAELTLFANEVNFSHGTQEIHEVFLANQGGQ